MSTRRTFRLYDAADAGSDGYCAEWHSTIKHLVRELAGNRCVRCKHPYLNGQHGRGEWTPCDEQCEHKGPYRWRFSDDEEWDYGHDEEDWPWSLGAGEAVDVVHVEARWRILTVHHLQGPGSELDCRWFNLVALCQRCHLSVQSRVKLDRPYFLEHSEWIKPYVAGFYAWKYEGREITREEAEQRMDELLTYEAKLCAVRSRERSAAAAG